MVIGDGKRALLHDAEADRGVGRGLARVVGQETVARVQEIAKQHGTAITTLSVAWVLANPAITSVILGASRVEQLADTLAATDCKLDSALKARLDEVSIEFRRGDAGK
jgi:1-deoxyxylulose-5-phosphate synthase